MQCAHRESNLNVPAMLDRFCAFGQLSRYYRQFEIGNLRNAISSDLRENINTQVTGTCRFLILTKK